MKSLSLSDRMIISAKETGYTANHLGKIFKPNGKEVRGTPLKHAGHLRVTLYSTGVNNCGYCSVLKHRFIAYFFLGLTALQSELIRHLNDDPQDNRIENLKAGTYKENRADIPREKISGPAKIHAYKLIERARKLTDKDIFEIRKIRETQKLPYYKIAPLFNISTMTAFRAANKISWSSLNES